MRRRRPNSVLVIAILQLVFGGIGLLCSVLSGAMHVAGAGRFQANAGPQRGGSQRLQAEMEELRKQREPAWQPAYNGFNMGVSLVDSCLMVIGAVGLLQMRPWGRWLTIVYAVISIITNLVSAAYTFAVEGPMMRDIMDT